MSDNNNSPNNNILNKIPVTGKLVLLCVGLSLVFGFVGAYSFNYWTAHKSTSSLGVAQSKNVVISEQNATINVAKKVSPSVVSITTSTASRDQFGRNTQSQGAGTGIIITANGLILTNKHVVEGGSSFVVVTSDGKEYNNVKLVASDPVNDIAFLRIEGASGLTPAEIGDSSKVEIGSFVVAIGNALGQYQNTVTTGVISGKSRPITAADGGGTESLQNLFQTDAAINPGNSGGPLVNVEGQVIGINTAIAGEGSQNIGFAIPINEAKRDISTVESSGKIIRAYVGVRYIPITPAIAKANNLSVDYGAYLQAGQGNSAVQSGSPADKAGLKNNDIILKVDDVKIDASNSLTSLVNQHAVGDSVTLTIYRDGKEQLIKVTLAEAPSS